MSSVYNDYLERHRTKVNKAFFYGRNRSFDVVKKFQKAWLNHIHRNPHLY